MRLFLIVSLLFWRVEASSLPLQGQVIVIDPGHGGIDGGATGGALVEKAINLTVSLKLRDFLQQQGAFVVLTRETDRDLAEERAVTVRDKKRSDLMMRAELVRQLNPDIVVSVHLNALPEERWSGAQTFHTKRNRHNEALAKAVQTQLTASLGNTKREAKHIGHVYLLNQVTVPAVLVEGGFLSNRQERRLLATEQYQEKLAAAIHRGLLHYYKIDNIEKR